MYRRHILQWIPVSISLLTGSIASPTNAKGLNTCRTEHMLGSTLAKSPKSGEVHSHRARSKIGVISVGGIGRAVLANIHTDIHDVTCTIAINTDKLSLERADANYKIFIRQSYAQSLYLTEEHNPSTTMPPELANIIRDLDFVILVAGLGGVAGSSISPFVAQYLRNAGIPSLTVAITPFDFEGLSRHTVANESLNRLKEHAQALICMRNSDIEKVVDPNDSLDAVMAHVPNAIHHLCRGIADTLGNSSLIGIEFDDFWSAISRYGGQCAFGYGTSCNCFTAAKLAVWSPFLGPDQLNLAKSAIVVIKGPRNTMSMQEISRAVGLVRNLMPVDAQVSYSCMDSGPTSTKACTVSILAAGIET
jgi:cell division GTPase FtsZ